MDTPNLSATLLIVSPDCTVYVKGVGLGRGVSAATRPSGVCTVSKVARGLWVEVANGMRVEDRGVDSVSCEVHEIKRKLALSSVEVRADERRMRCMRRL